MQTWSEWLTYMGINIPVAFAGMLGGMLKALMSNRGDLIGALTSVMAGLTVANYLGSIIAAQFVSWNLPAPGAGFLTGYVAVILIDKLTEMAKAWVPKAQQERKDA